MELSVSHQVFQARPARSMSAGRLRASRLRYPLGRRDQRGIALLEFAIVAPAFFFLLYALVVFGMALALKQSVTNAATEGARSALGQSSDAAAITKAQDTAKGRLNWLSTSQKASLTVNATVVSPCPVDPPAVGTGKCIKVTVSYPYDANPLVPSAPIIKQLQPKTISSIAYVQIG